MDASYCSFHGSLVFHSIYIPHLCNAFASLTGNSDLFNFIDSVSNSIDALDKLIEFEIKPVQTNGTELPVRDANALQRCRM